MSRPNWFVAFEVRAPALVLHEVPAGVRAFHVEDLHATIAFLGGVEEARARAGWEALETNLAARDVTLGPVSRFGTSALAARIEDAALAAALGEARVAVWRAADARPDDRPPKAHVTLARLGRRATEAEARAAERWAAALDLRAVPARIERAALYTWSPDRRERLLRIVESRAL